jgi:hypothetical protein
MVNLQNVTPIHKMTERLWLMFLWKVYDYSVCCIRDLSVRQNVYSKHQRENILV